MKVLRGEPPWDRCCCLLRLPFRADSSGSLVTMVAGLSKVPVSLTQHWLSIGDASMCLFCWLRTATTAGSASCKSFRFQQSSVKCAVDLTFYAQSWSQGLEFSVNAFFSSDAALGAAQPYTATAHNCPPFPKRPNVYLLVQHSNVCRMRSSSVEQSNVYLQGYARNGTYLG